MIRDTIDTTATTTTEELFVDFSQGRENLPLLQLNIQHPISIQYPI